MDSAIPVRMRINNRAVEARVEPRLLLADFLRDQLGLKGVHLGCEHGICGTCTILIDGASVRSCLTFAVQADGKEIETVEGLAGSGETLDPIQEAFWEAHGLQCGYCTPGVLMTAKELLREHPDPTEKEVRRRISGNLCRCTGYQFIVDAILLAARKLRETSARP